MTDEKGELIHAVIQQNANGGYFIQGAPDPYGTIAQLVGSLRLTPVPRNIMSRKPSDMSLDLSNEDVEVDIVASPRKQPQVAPPSVGSPRGVLPNTGPASTTSSTAATATAMTLKRAGSMRDVFHAAASGKTHHSGVLSKKGQRRLFVLQDNVLEWFDVQAVSNPDSLAKGRLDLSGCKLTAGINDKSFMLQAADGTAAFELRADTANEARAWVHVLQKVFDANNSARDEAAESMALGVGVDAPARKGMLSVRGKQRYCVLLRAYLMWMESPKKAELLGSVPLAGASLQRNADGEATFVVTSAHGDEPLELTARDAKEARDWCTSVREAIDYAATGARAAPGDTYRQHTCALLGCVGAVNSRLQGLAEEEGEASILHATRRRTTVGRERGERGERQRDARRRRRVHGRRVCRCRRATGWCQGGVGWRAQGRLLVGEQGRAGESVPARDVVWACVHIRVAGARRGRESERAA
jgi:hypothetical protein